MKRTGTAFRSSKKEPERRSGAFRLETNPGIQSFACIIYLTAMDWVWYDTIK